MKTLIIAAAALATLVATPASADPKKHRNDREHGQRWDRDDHRGNGHSGDRGRGRGNGRSVPPGHLPPPGACRVWIDGTPPGHQPPVTSCRQARRDAYRYGGRVIFGGRR
ncbi:hypothetical protein [Croceibacterium ferulae]|uniref:hypothetical protein n=1 Tax=Croceibacterium ferulae TaxID=1854641 RepID=UPI000EAC19B9|nr:hypothetical protein [Croceibacterium ferulae]